MTAVLTGTPEEVNARARAIRVVNEDTRHDLEQAGASDEVKVEAVRRNVASVRAMDMPQVRRLAARWPVSPRATMNDVELDVRAGRVLLTPHRPVAHGGAPSSRRSRSSSRSHGPPGRSDDPDPPHPPLADGERP